MGRWEGENFPSGSTFGRSATSKHEESKVQEIKLALVLNSSLHRVFWTRVLSLSLSLLLLAARHTFGRSATSKHEESKVHESDWTGEQLSQFNPLSDVSQIGQPN